MFDWFDLLTKFQLKRNDEDRKAAIRIIEKSEQQFQRHFEGKQIKGNFYLVGALYGVFAAQRVNAQLYNKMHQAFRRSCELPEYSLLEQPDTLSRAKVIQSFAEIRISIYKRRAENEQRDLRQLTLWLLLISFISGVLALFM